MNKICNRCENILILSHNWTTGRQKKNDYICKPCVNTRHKSRSAYKQQRITNTVKKQFDKRLSLKITNFMMDAKKRNKSLEFSYAEIGHLMQQSCTYCGDKEQYNGLDRVDSSKGYLKTNVVPCCAVCNIAKNTLSSEDYIEHCKKVIAFRSLK